MVSQAQVGLGTTSQATIATLPLAALKTADETVNNSTTLISDSQIKLTLGANETWDVTLLLRVISAADADMDFAIVVPSGASFDGHLQIRGAVSLRMVETAEVTGIGGTAQDEIVIIQGTVRMGSTPGDAQLQWAQNVAQMSDAKVQIGSSMRGWRSA